MFERRLKILLGLFGLAGLILFLRLGQLQLVHADDYRRRAQAALVRRPTPLPFIRGSIVDRAGRVLVADEPCWDVSLDYSVIAAEVGGDKTARSRASRRWRRRTRSHQPALEGDELARAFDAELDRMWLDLARFASRRSPTTSAELRERAGVIYRKVRTIRDAVAVRRGFDAPVAEEHDRHAVITALTAEEQIAARETFARYPFVYVEPSSVRRVVGDATSVAHVLGRTGRVTREDIERDSNAGDPFAEYLPHERRGISGVEWLAEGRLRGRRGQVTLDREGQVIEHGTFAAQHGRDVALTIDRVLQDRLYDLLGEVVREVPTSSGGAIVVLDVASRNVLALLSYPSYDPARFDDLYPDLREDTERLPLWFRAVASRYAPGSTVKPLVCLTGLMNGVISLDTRESCAGYLFEDQPDVWRCWQIHGSQRRKAHGSINVVAALVGSCNVFMYRLGERLGVDGLCSAFDMVGIGRGSGIGLREEDRGINPTPSWLMVNKNLRVTPGTARLFAIGQGELSTTPLQLANLMATYASGRFAEVRLLKSDEPRPEWTLPCSREHWLAIRRGMYGVVNDRAGTAYGHAYFVHPRYALVGKTGSATAYPWPTAYAIAYVDGQGHQATALVKAGARGAAIRRFVADHPGAIFDAENIEIARRWPDVPPASGDNHAHAWFGGFLQELDAVGKPDWSREPRLAFAALVEFGGSGGRVSGPLARRIAGVLVEYTEGRASVASTQP